MPDEYSPEKIHFLIQTPCGRIVFNNGNVVSELALSVGIKTHGIVTEWVKRYRAAAPQALRVDSTSFTMYAVPVVERASAVGMVFAEKRRDNLSVKDKGGIG